MPKYNKQPEIVFIVEALYSKQDTCGNTCGACRITSTRTGHSRTICDMYDCGPSSLVSMACSLMGVPSHYKTVMVCEFVDQRRKDITYFCEDTPTWHAHEVSPEMIAGLTLTKIAE